MVRQTSAGRMVRWIAVAVSIAFIGGGIANAQVIQVDPKLPAYTPAQGVSGNLSSVGSDTMNNLMTLWAEGFKKFYLDVNVQIEGKGSSTAPPALIAGTAQFGPMSRAMKSKEVDAFDNKYGFKPARLRVAMDGLAVYVNKDNPLRQRSLEQIDAIFSKTRKRGFLRNVLTWGHLGLTGDWATRQISLYGRNSASGTYGFFKSKVLKKGDYKDEVKEQPGSASVVQGITEDLGGIGYSGIGYRTSGVKTLTVAKKQGAKAYAPTFTNVTNKKYPIGRFLNLYVVKNPTRPLDPLRREFVKFVFSKEGQRIVVKDGYLPISAKIAAKELRKIGLDRSM